MVIVTALLLAAVKSIENAIVWYVVRSRVAMSDSLNVAPRAVGAGTSISLQIRR
jgi:hypothetical protein